MFKQPTDLDGSPTADQPFEFSSERARSSHILISQKLKLLRDCLQKYDVGHGKGELFAALRAGVISIILYTPFVNKIYEIDGDTMTFEPADIKQAIINCGDDLNAAIEVLYALSKDYDDEIVGILLDKLLVLATLFRMIVNPHDVNAEEIRGMIGSGVIQTIGDGWKTQLVFLRDAWKSNQAFKLLQNTDYFWDEELFELRRHVEKFLAESTPRYRDNTHIRKSINEYSVYIVWRLIRLHIEDYNYSTKNVRPSISSPDLKDDSLVKVINELMTTAEYLYSGGYPEDHLRLNELIRQLNT